jgi:peptidoglycan hydrolase-like protein with peptidoglycan-binding domain
VPGDSPAALKPEPPLLRLGSEGRQVKRLQRLLRQQLLPEPAKVDGDFGQITGAAVKAFQEFHGLAPDGIVGPLTWRALETADVAAAAKELEPA